MNNGFHGLFLILRASGVLSRSKIFRPSKTWDVANSNNAITSALHTVLRRNDKEENLPFSPFSLSAAMAMIKAGANGSTATEIQRGMRYPVCMYLNRVYVQNGFSLNPEYSKTLETYFGVEAQQVDFVESAAAASKINGWVEDVTRNKIKDLFPSVDMMESASDYLYVDLTGDLDARAVALPYKGDQLSMIIVLPNKPDGLATLENKLENYNLAEVPSKMRNSKVHLSLPRFRLESTIDLAGILSEMGMDSMFLDTADFSGIPAPEKPVPLKVSKAMQKTFLEVNEEGSEAGAATGIEFGTKGLFSGPVVNAEHPFIAYILDNSTSSILFVTSVVNPTN